MQFHYIASRPDGKVIEGETDAQGMAEVLEIIASKGLRPISVKPVRTLAQGVRSRFFTERINISDQVFLTKYLGLMLKVGTDLFNAIDILIADFDKPSVKALLLEMRSNLEKGKPFYATFANYPKIFSPVFINMIKAGESSGNLEKVFDDLSVSLEREQSLRNRIKGALVYPVLLMVASVLILILLVSFALPKIAGIFLTGGFQPPLFSRVVFAIGLFFGDNLWLILSIMISGGTTFWFFFSRNIIFRRVVTRFVRKLPVIREIIRRVGVQRFASTLSSLLKSGLPIVDSLEITADAVGNEEIKTALMRISREGISKGLTIGEAFKREEAFPKVVTNLIAISEKSGHVEEILDTLSHFYESEIDASLKTLVALLEPLLLLGIGVIIAVIALAIIVPIYQLVGQF